LTLFLVLPVNSAVLFLVYIGLINIQRALSRSYNMTGFVCATILCKACVMSRIWCYVCRYVSFICRLC
jgi:hypothetical protein